MKARVLIRDGRLAEASRWRTEAGVAIDDELSFLREFEHVTLARLLIAEGDEAGPTLLDRLRDAAERGRRFGSVLEIAVLQSLAQRADLDVALAHLSRALAIAEPEGFVQILLDEGEAMAVLLKAAVKRGIAPRFARTLLAALQPDSDGLTTPASRNDLTEPLSERERDVLRLLRTDLDGPEIARELKVSLNTMRTHTRNIYEKLGVSSRRAAVRRADELMLLRRPPR